MRTRILIALFAFCFLTLTASAQLQALNVKLGLWEITSTRTMTGAPSIPPEVMAQMPPDQRARMEAAIKAQSGGTTTQKICITKEKLEKSNMFRDQRKECTYTLVSSSPTKIDEKFKCVEQKMTMDGTVHVEVLTPESTKTAVRTKMTGQGQNMSMDFDVTSRYLGPSCGDVK